MGPLCGLAQVMSDWPYPFWIAHRGAGQLAPENTLAAFRVGADLGWRMFECDAKLSADGVLFLLHDDTLDRTTNGVGLPSSMSWAELSLLDAGSWHSSTFAGEALPTLQSVVRFMGAGGGLLNIEIKPCPGFEEKTGKAVAEFVANRWPAGLEPPLISSFSEVALEAARQTHPGQRRGLLLEGEMPPDWLERAQALACVSVTCHYSMWTADAVACAGQHGLRTLAFTVNEAADVRRLVSWGIDGLFTDRVDAFGAAAAAGIRGLPESAGTA